MRSLRSTVLKPQELGIFSFAGSGSSGAGGGGSFVRWVFGRKPAPVQVRGYVKVGLLTDNTNGIWNTEMERIVRNFGRKENVGASTVSFMIVPSKDADARAENEKARAGLKNAAPDIAFFEYFLLEKAGIKRQEVADCLPQGAKVMPVFPDTREIGNLVESAVRKTNTV